MQVFKSEFEMCDETYYFYQGHVNGFPPQNIIEI